MPERRIRRALISVYDKTGIVDFARALVNEFGIEIISTGGTASLLKENGIPVTLVETITGFPEMLDGRVKTLHPKIHAAILADRDNPDHMRQLAEQGIEPIDMVVVNLYPFEKTIADPNCTFEQAIEMIDIGGPCLLRAAAKNHMGAIPVVGHRAYARIVDVMRGSGGVIVPASMRCHHARVAFHITNRYDAHVTAFFADVLRKQFETRDDIDFFRLPALGPAEELRYGENPHQHAAFRPFVAEDLTARCVTDTAAIGARETSVELSFNNLADADAAVALCNDLGATHQYVCIFIKHTNPCGVGVAENPEEAYRRAYVGDVSAAMGGVLACSFQITREFAIRVMDSLDAWGRRAGASGFFIEVWLAPGFDNGAVEIIRSRKTWGERARLLNRHLLNHEGISERFVFKSLSSGLLIQSADDSSIHREDWNVVTKQKPSESELSDLRLAWLIAKHTKSNAISICTDGMLIGNGAGQMLRVMSCRIATWLAKENGHAEKLQGSVAASDAFFPFADGPNLLMDAGVTAIIQPGGSKRDEEVIAACDARNVAMIFTGTRHFRH